MTPKRLFLLDAYALIFRGYYAFIKNPRINSKGLDTSAIMGFMNSLFEVINKEKPEYLAVVFDKGGSDFRSNIFAQYKANRDETPEAIKIAVPYIQQILKLMRIHTVEMAGIEADDLIGTLSKKAEKENFKVYMMTPDKDYAQLVSENIFMYRPSRMGNGIEIWGEEEVKQKFEIEHPLQVIDFLAMMGDAVDNIPGLPGVGEKTAKKLLAEFGSIENLFENTDKLKGALKTKIENNREQGLLSKKLATILLDCPVEFDADTFKMSAPDIEGVRAVFQDLEFKRLTELFLKSIPNFGADGTTITENFTEDLFSEVSSFGTLNNTLHLYQIVDGALALNLLINSLTKQKQIAFVEHNATEHIGGIGIVFQKNTGYFIPTNKENKSDILLKLKPIFENPQITLIGYNLKPLVKSLLILDINPSVELFDVGIAHYLINPDSRHNLDILSENYLKYTLTNITPHKGTPPTIELLRDSTTEQADICFQLKNLLEEELNQTNTYKLFRDIEIPLISVLASMENEGINIDTNFLNSLAKELREELALIENNIYSLAEETFNLSSPKQLGEILFEKLKLGGTKQKKTKTGQYATGEEILQELAPENPIVQDILQWRQLTKLLNTYIESLPNQINTQSGRIHTDYTQTTAATGRLSSNNPNLQNIPIRTQRGKEVRKAFIPRNDDYILLSADYSQIELRIIAALSKEPHLTESFALGHDIHKSTAAKVFNVPLEAVTKEQRSHAKTVNFGIIYGVSAFGLSNQTSLSRAESAELIDTYYKTYPKLKEYIQNQIAIAREQGFVQTVLGRRRYLKDINSQNAVVRGAAERNAINAPIQGSAADIIKIAMINIQQQIQKAALKSRMLLQVHDELVFDVYKPELEQIKQIIKYEMENAFSFDVPLVVDIGVGNNWLEAH
ncbi:MAG: DNA polymerase I [Bacteroidota bacterium]|nr:DNA polymerase I [Bacteroidota bacterium]